MILMAAAASHLHLAQDRYIRAAKFMLVLKVLKVTAEWV
jgi:hypothetical protein